MVGVPGGGGMFQMYPSSDKKKLIDKIADITIPIIR